MKDIDFDELDKAVNTLMAGVSKPSEPKDNGSHTQEEPVDASTTSPSTMSNTGTSLTSTAATSTPSTSSPSSVNQSIAASKPAPAARRTGRFMDVVTPATPKKPDVGSKPVSRSGTTIEPSKPTIPEPVTPPVSLSSTPTLTTPEPSTPSKPATDVPPQTDWPDPLDVANFTDHQVSSEPTPAVKESTKESSLSPAEKAISEPMTSAEADEAEPLVTPFLPDTKVEKRPLGANATSSTKPDVLDETKTSQEASEADDQLPATTEDVKSLLPEELHSDLVAIESDTTEPEQLNEPKAEMQEPADHPVAPSTPAAIAEEHAPLKTTSPASGVVGPTSIPQQYKEEAPVGEQKNGAIYDTQTYHKPLAHPAKQKSGWMWIVWIILILLIGAGAGAALYFLGIYKF